MYYLHRFALRQDFYIVQVQHMEKVLTGLLTAAEVAELAGCEVATVARAAQSGKLATEYKAPGVTGLRLFSRASVDDWMATRKKTSS